MPFPGIVGTSSGAIIADTTVKVGPGTVHSITIQWGTTTQNDIRLQDGGTGGTIKWGAKHSAVVAAGDATDHFVFPAGIEFGTDIFLKIVAGSGVQAWVVYD